MNVAGSSMYGRVRIGPRSAVVIASVLVISTAGCGEAEPELVPVVGKVTIDGQPATEGAVTFRHASSGAFEASGLIGPDGTYKLMQKDREGARMGEYRVVVFVRKTPRTPSGEMAGLPAIIVNQKFTDPDTTPLNIDVKQNAPSGHYDLAVTR